MNPLSIILFSLTIFGGLVTFVLSLLELRDKRKKFLGVMPQRLKRFTATLTLLFCIGSVMIQARKEYSDYRESLEQKRKLDSVSRRQDSIARYRFDTTLKSVGIAIETLRVNLQATRTVQSGQQVALAEQAKTLAANGRILHGQELAFNDLKNIIAQVDRITKAKLVVSGVLPGGAEMQEFKQRLALGNCLLASTNVDFVKKGCLSSLNLINGVSVYFFSRKIDSSKIGRLLRTMKDAEIFGFESELSVETKKKIACYANFGAYNSQMDNEYDTATVQLYNDERTAFTVAYDPHLFIADGAVLSFDSLKDMNCIIIVESKYVSLQIDGLLVQNQEDTKRYPIEIGGTLLKRPRNGLSGKGFTTVYWGKNTWLNRFAPGKQ